MSGHERDEGLFGERSSRIWGVLGGMATVATLVWTAVLVVGNDSTAGSGRPGANATRTTTPTTHPSAAPPATTRPGPTQSSEPPARPATTPPISGGIWIAQLASVDVRAGSGELQRVQTQVQRDVPQVQVLASSEYASLRSGYWVVYYRGPFVDGTAALTFCRIHGRTIADECVGRYLSNDPTDSKYICFPPGSTLPSHCRHD